MVLLVAGPAGLLKRPDPPPGPGCRLTIVTDRATVCLGDSS